MKSLEIKTDCDGETETLVFHDFPVLLGRDESCHVHLPFPFISRFHARIERVDDGEFVLFDESSRNGIEYEGSRIDPKQPLSVRDGAIFFIERLVVTVRIRDRGDATTEPMTMDAHEGATSLYADEQIIPAVLGRAGTVLEEYHAARVAAIRGVASSLEAMDDGERRATAQQLSTDHPALMHDPGFFRLIARYVPDVRSPTTGSLSEEASTAFTLVQQLASAYVPSAPMLKTVEDMDLFVARVDKVLRSFLTGKVALDFVYQCERGSNVDVEAGRAQRLGSELLDWRQEEKASQLEFDFFAIARDHAALVSDVESVLEGILGELSPAAIEWESRRTRWYGPFWAQSLWEAFRERHSRIASTVSARLGARFGRVREALSRDVPRPPAMLGSGTSAARRESQDEAEPFWPFADAVSE